jgi:hypothetical protein
MNIPTVPVNMISGKGSGAALAVLGLLLALTLMAPRTNNNASTQRN